MTRHIKAFLLLISILPVSVYAQDWKKNWMLEAAFGGQMMFSEDASLLKFSERITPAISLGVGKWFSPVWGARLKGQFYQLNGAADSRGLYVADEQGYNIYGTKDPVVNHVDVNPDGTYKRFVRFLNIEMDLQMSLANAIFGYKPERRWDVIPAVGLGYLRTFDYKGSPATNNISTNFSLTGKYRVAKRWDVKLELANTLVPGTFDGRITNIDYEDYLSLSAGVIFHIGQQGFENTSPVVAVAPVNRTEYVERLVHDTVIVHDTIKEIDAMVLKQVRIGSVLFDCGKTTPKANQEVIFINIVDFLKANPNVRVDVTCYSDSKTGSAQRNEWLSMKRAKYVEAALLKRGVNPDQIRRISWMGSSTQVYDISLFNRLVLVTPVTEK